jgi:monofunctional biosynthetic peptidoglycan transglycosylase
MSRILKIISTLLLIPLVGVAYTFYIYFSADVGKLKSLKPIYDSKAQTYKLLPKSSGWVPLENISYLSRWAILVSEDWAFYDHKGVDYNQLKIVFDELIVNGTLSRGASTISQQVVKNIFLTNERSLLRKFKEVIITYKLEQNLTKDEILGVYLNLVELGKNIYGIKDASYYYFEKHPSKLDAREGAFLAMLLPSPKKYSISFREGKLTDFAKEVMSSILVKLRQAKKITEEERVLLESESFFWEE